MSTYEDDLRHSLKAEFDTGRIREVVDAAKVFSQLSKVYPTSGSKIDWKNIQEQSSALRKINPYSLSGLWSSLMRCVQGLN